MSLASRIYMRLPPWMQDLAISVYGMKLERMRYRGVHSSVLGDLKRSEWYPEDQIRDLVNRRLRRTVLDAYRDVPWYAENLPKPPDQVTVDTLAEFPILTKATLQASPDQFLSTTFASHQLHSIFTGGTTGTPLEVKAPVQTLQTNYAHFMRFRAWAGVEGKARTATFAGRAIVPAESGSPYWRHNRAGNTWLFSSYHLSPSTIPEYVAALDSISPEVIDAYPSSIEPIAKYILNNGIRRIRPTAVITSSETLLPQVRTLIENAFGCPVFDHYGGAEMAAFITQCESGRYHVNPEFGVVEIVHNGRAVDPGESGEIVATGFINPAMPLIRYGTGDLGAFSKTQECPCGRAFPVIERIEGRMDDVILTPDGRTVGRIDPIFKASAAIHEARVVQDRPDRLILEFVAGDGFEPDHLKALVDALQVRVGPRM